MEVDEISSTAAIETHPNTLVSPVKNQEHLNIPTLERQNLLADLSAALKTDKVPASFWAFLQVCDISKLQELVNQARADSAGVWNIAGSCRSVIGMWKQWPQNNSRQGSGVSTPAQSQPSATSSRSRNSKPSRLAKQRDGHSCVFTGFKTIHAAHIYPECLINHRPFELTLASQTLSFWKLLQHFWTPKQVQEWQQVIFPDPDNPESRSDGCFNRICMQPSAHTCWGKGHFALRPLEYNDDKSELKVEWYWQPQHIHEDIQLVELSKLPLSSRDLDESHGNTFPIEQSTGSYARIRSGQIFTFKTSEPSHLRLPSKELLDLQWHLNRIVSMSAAAENSEEEDGDDDYGSSGIEQWIDDSICSASPSACEVPCSEVSFYDESDSFRRSFSSTPIHNFASQDV